MNSLRHSRSSNIDFHLRVSGSKSVYQNLVLQTLSVQVYLEHLFSTADTGKIMTRSIRPAHPGINRLSWFRFFNYIDRGEKLCRQKSWPSIGTSWRFPQNTSFMQVMSASKMLGLNCFQNASIPFLICIFSVHAIPSCRCVWSGWLDPEWETSSRLPITSCWACYSAEEKWLGAISLCGDVQRTADSLPL